jgi:hypothetical protein
MSSGIDTIVLIFLKIGIRDGLSINFDQTNNRVIIQIIATFGHALK